MPGPCSVKSRPSCASRAGLVAQFGDEDEQGEQSVYVADAASIQTEASECVRQHVYVKLAVVRRERHAHGWARRGEPYKTVFARRLMGGDHFVF